MIERLLRRLQGRLLRSKHFHIRTNEISKLSELVDLLDRFIDDELTYPLEWDDFISWKNSHFQIEKIRTEIADLEGKFCSADPLEREDALQNVRTIRDRVAGVAGCRRRNPPTAT